MKSDRATGVYCIRNVINRKVYIGSAAISFRRRWNEHKGKLLKGSHGNKHLQSAWDKYGAEAFEFRILQVVGIEELLATEQAMIDFHKSAERRFGYNIAPIAGSLLGHRHSPESKAKIVTAQLGKKATPEHRAKISASNMGHHVSDETRAKIAEKARNRKASPQTRAKMSASHKLQSPETRAKIAAAGRGRKHSPETRAKISESNRRRGVTEETRAKMSASRIRLFAERRLQHESVTNE